MIAICLLLSMTTQAPPDFKAWGLDALNQIQRDLFMPANQLYGEEARPGESPKSVAYTWSVGVMIQALNAAARVDRSCLPRLEAYVSAAKSYWNPEGPFAGFDVLPTPKPKDRYYDDNEWMVLALVESSSLLKSKKTLGLARDAFNYVMSGHDSKLGGGIYWRESDKASKNTCSNAPAAAAALALYDATKEEKYLKIAEDLYEWTKIHLRDPVDGLYWDNISLSGRIERTKWSYNTGLMLRSAADLYRLTKQNEYADDCREIQASSLKHWTGTDGSFKDDGKFIHLLLENWLRAYRLVPGVADPRAAVIAGLTRLHSLSCDALGHYGNRWDETPKNGPYSPYKLIDQASAARAFFEAATL